jgi:hypothetical protein
MAHSSEMDFKNLIKPPKYIDERNHACPRWGHALFFADDIKLKPSYPLTNLL